MPKITKRVVDAAEPNTKSVFIWDSEIAGFGLQVYPSGRKSYVYQYRTPQGRTRRATLGRSSETFTAAAARDKAKKYRRTVEDGGDPLADKQAERKAMTLAQLLDAYTDSPAFADKAQSTQDLDKSRIKRHLKPTLGKKYVHQLRPDDVRRAFGAIRDGKTAIDEKTGFRGRAIVKGGEGAARMAIRVLRSALNWAIKEGKATDNPASSVEIGHDGNRDIILKDPKQYTALFKTLEQMENEKRLRPQVADAIRVIALTGARRSEIAGLRWKHVSLETGILTLPPSAHKTGKKTNKPRIIGLPAAAQAVIAKQDEGEPDDYVFPPRSGKGPLNLSKPWRQIREEAGLPEGIGLHGLRHSFASYMAMNGAQAAEIMTVLGHRQITTAQKYIHWAQDGRAALAEKAAAHISGALEDKKHAEILPLRKHNDD
ncbi:integrase [Thiohalobacter sp. COW1]|uniref:site-specific integrase n=1 Tax=Thiohalobacter sp. COW1 TaxID=2795687 RepID=UPI001916C840|nr:site-specific integrase [Thiohalobacter sp. COW1]BCO32883.1 integrase [Thiohalobacter sp. COW1]